MNGAGKIPWRRALLGVGASLILLVVWPALRPLYAPAFRSLAGLTLRVIDPLPTKLTTHFEAGTDPELATDLPRMDTIVSLRHEDFPGRDARFGASSFTHAYSSTALILALFLASGLDWKRRWKRLVAGLGLLHAFFALRLVMAVFYALSKSHMGGRPAVDLGPEEARVLFFAWHFLWEEPVANILTPLVIWALCMFGPRSKAPPGP